MPNEPSWFHYIIILMFIVLPALQWIFKKLYQLSQGAESAVANLQRARATREDTAQEDDEWEIIEKEDAAGREVPFGPSVSTSSMDRPTVEDTRDRSVPAFVTAGQTTPPAQQARPARPTPRAAPARPTRTPQQEITSFLEQLAGGVPPRPARPAPARPQPAPPRPRPQPVAKISPLLEPSAPIQGRSETRRQARKAAGKGITWRGRLRERILWSEILAPPVALRKHQPGEGPSVH